MKNKSEPGGEIASLDIKLQEKEEPPGPEQAYPSLLYFSKATVEPKITDNGISVLVNNQEFNISYPKRVWQAYPKQSRQILAENLAYCSTFSLPYLAPDIQSLYYKMPLPISESYLFKGLCLSLPSLALTSSNGQRVKTSELIRKLLTINYSFSSAKSFPAKIREKSCKENVVIPFSFGKDSLLTFALCQELNLNPYLVYLAEPTYTYEEQVKKKLSQEFSNKFGINVSVLKNNLGIFRQKTGDIGWELQLTQYSLMLLPFVEHHKAGLILFANEQSCNDTVIDKEGFAYNPVYEQSASWLASNSFMTSLVGGNSLSIGSIIEPIYELAIVKILHCRYKEIAKFQMSCDPQDKYKNRLNGNRWCQNCSKCARIYIFLLAHGIDPKSVGIKDNLLGEEHAHLYPIFNLSSSKAYSYDQSGAGRDEQLLAYLMAYRLGAKGTLIDSFEKEYLVETENREKELRSKFFGIHSITTVPSEFRSKLLQIYKKELSSLS